MQVRSLYRWARLAGLILLSLLTAALVAERATAQDDRILDSVQAERRGLQAVRPPENSINVTQPLAGLTPEQLKAFSVGRAEFERTWRREDGLGPLFNAVSCASCHHLPDIGGGGPRYRSNFNFGFHSGAQFDPLADMGGPLLQERALIGRMREQVPAQANVFSLRRVAPLLGLGLVEAIPDAQIRALADEGDADGDGISGRVALTPAGRVQRFGSQNQVASLRSFVEKALAEEIGITSTEAPAQTVPLMRAFIAFSAPFPRGNRDAAVVEGEKIFLQLGCASCHVASFSTAPGAFTTADGEVIAVAALQNQTIFPYSDFLLHDMGPELNDGVALSGGNSAEYRTTPLWGLRFRRNYLHDGRAANLRQALLFHGGEAKAARRAFLDLLPEEQELLAAFLDSL